MFKWTQNGVYWVGLLWGGPRGNPKRSYHSSNDNIWYDFPTYTYYWY